MQFQPKENGMYTFQLFINMIILFKSKKGFINDLKLLFNADLLDSVNKENYEVIEDYFKIICFPIHELLTCFSWVRLE